MFTPAEGTVVEIMVYVLPPPKGFLEMPAHMQEKYRNDGWADLPQAFRKFLVDSEAEGVRSVH